MHELVNEWMSEWIKQCRDCKSKIGIANARPQLANRSRDRENRDRENKIGIEKAKDYHRALIFGGILLAITFVFPSPNYFHYIFAITIPIFVGFVQSIQKRNDFENFDPFLKKQAITTFIFSILFVIGINF